MRARMNLNHHQMYLVNTIIILRIKINNYEKIIISSADASSFVCLKIYEYVFIKKKNLLKNTPHQKIVTPVITKSV